MSISSRTPNLLAIIVVLVLTNLAVLAYFMWFKKDPCSTADRDRNSATELLKKDVGFSDKQLEQYKAMKEAQREKTKPMFESMRRSKDSLFSLIGNANANDSILDGLTSHIAAQQKAIDIQTFNYFRKIRTLCEPGQQVKYDSMVVRMFRKPKK